MKALDDEPVSLWSQWLASLSDPAALIDRHGHYVYLNEASRSDPVLARGSIGKSSLDHCRDVKEIWLRAHRRHTAYAQVVLTQKPVFFAEEVSTHKGEVRSLLWVCMPVLELEGEIDNVAVIGLDLAGWFEPLQGGHAAPPDAPATRLGQVAQEMRMSLAAMVSLAHTLARELSGTQSKQAALIEHGGLRLLHRLDALPEEVSLNLPGMRRTGDR